MPIISLEQATEMINNANKIYGVVFEKRTNGIDRVMSCLNNVHSRTNGNGLSFDPASKGLIPTYDMNVRGYRMINLRGLKKLRMNKTEYIVRK